jgi:hypothetical protein
MIQTELEFAPVIPESNESSILARFVKFHESNPHVYRNLVTLARQFRSKNKSKQMGIGMLYEVLRWNYYLTIDFDENYRLSNDFRACYSRLIMEKEPDLEGAFNTRPSHVDE